MIFSNSTDSAIVPISGHGGARPGSGRKPNAEKTDAYLLYAKAKAQREVISAKLADLELKKLSGDLIQVADVIREIDQAARACKEALLSIPGRCADLIAAETDARAVERLLDKEIRAALQQLANAYGHDGDR